MEARSLLMAGPLPAYIARHRLFPSLHSLYLQSCWLAIQLGKPSSSFYLRYFRMERWQAATEEQAPQLRLRSDIVEHKPSPLFNLFDLQPCWLAFLPDILSLFSVEKTTEWTALSIQLWSRRPRSEIFFSS